MVRSRRILVLGASGMLGHKLCQQLPRDGHGVVGTTRGKADPLQRMAPIFGGCELLGGIDPTQGPSLLEAFDRVQPDVVVNAVGIVKQKKEAHDETLSQAVNADLPHQLAALCAERGARLLHVSTDCVFDGARGNYLETDPINAADLYGRSKARGETRADEPAALTLRTSIIGREITRPTHGLVEWILSSKGKAVNGFARAVYSGLTTLEFCRIIGRLVDDPRGLTGTVHVAAEPINKYELLRLVDRAYGLKLTIRRDEEIRCDRTLKMGRFAEATGYRAPSWPEMIDEMARDATPYDRLIVTT